MQRHFGEHDELPPTMGVREPRKPKPPTLSPGYALDEPPATEPAPGADPRVTVVVSR